MTWFGLVILNTRSCLSIETDNSRNLGESSKFKKEKGRIRIWIPDRSVDSFSPLNLKLSTKV